MSIIFNQWFRGTFSARISLFRDTESNIFSKSFLSMRFVKFLKSFFLLWAKPAWIISKNISCPTAEGLVPAVVYGKKFDNVNLKVNAKALRVQSPAFHKRCEAHVAAQCVALR